MTPAPAAAGVIRRAIAGIEVGPWTTVVEARRLMAYAAGLGERDPRYYDAGGGGPLAHPLFAVCYEWPLALAVRAAAIDASVAALGVHALHRLTIHRPPRAGETLHTTARVTDVERRRAGTLVVIRFETVDAAGRPVTTTDHGSIYRGVDCDAGGPPPGGAAVPAARVAGREAAELRWVEEVAIAAHAAHVYTECARIWNPIHTDAAVARRAGLPGLVLHGTATLALAVSRVVERELAGDAARVREVSARFTGMVRLPSRLRVQGRGARDDVVRFDATDEANVPVLSEGVLRA